MSKSATILIVDDDEHVRRSLKRVLRRHNLSMASDGQEAIRMLLEPSPPYDVVLCDLMMPGATGKEVWERLAAEAPGREKLIVFLTGGAMTDEMATFLDNVPNLVLEKPFDLDVLRNMIDRVSGTGPVL